MPGGCGVLQAIEILIERLAGEEGGADEPQEGDVPAPARSDASAGQERRAAPGPDCPAPAGPETEQCTHNQHAETSAEGRSSSDRLAGSEVLLCTMPGAGASAVQQDAPGSREQGAALHEGDEEQHGACSVLGNGNSKHIGSGDAASNKKKPARNRECPCGSGKRYKNCCGPVQAAAARRVAGQDLEECAVSHTMTALYV